MCYKLPMKIKDGEEEEGDVEEISAEVVKGEEEASNSSTKLKFNALNVTRWDTFNMNVPLGKRRSIMLKYMMKMKRKRKMRSY